MVIARGWGKGNGKLLSNGKLNEIFSFGKWKEFKLKKKKNCIYKQRGTRVAQMVKHLTLDF